MSAILRPLASLYGAVTSIRNALYDRGVLPGYRSFLPVYCVGNLTAGGSGKTPLVLALAEALKRAGRSPVILSRGYGGSLIGPHRVSEHDPADAVGDEPKLMAVRDVAPVIVSRDRASGARFIEREKIGDLILLDDGFQHRRLKRDIDIIAIDCSSERSIQAFAAGRLLPEGRFREDRDAGLRRAGAVVLNHRKPASIAHSTGSVRSLIPAGIPLFETFLEVESILELSTRIPLPPNRRLIPFCALGNPEGFLATVRSLGHEVSPHYLKRDHEAFTNSELRKLLETTPDSALICTEKDAVKLREISVPVFILKVKLSIPEIDRLTGLLAGTSPKE